MEKDIRRNTNEMIREFSELPLSLLERAFCGGIGNSFIENDLEEITSPGTLENEEERGFLPGYGAVWMLDPVYSQIVEKNIQKISQIGFRVYKDNYSGNVYLGMDQNCNLMENFWIPLYQTIQDYIQNL